jgi:outer membrane murein-binding lipoprotein Lpp
MANQQLVDYIKGQTVAGVSEPDIKKILKDAGWPDADVEDGLKGAKGLASQPVVQSAVSPTVTSVSKPMEPVKSEPKKESASFDFMTNPGGMASMSSAGPVKESKPKDSKPLSMASDVAAPSGGKSSMLPWIVAGVAIVAMLGIGVYFYLQNSSLSSQADTLTAANSALSSELAALKGTPANVDELNAAKTDAAEANSELGLFVIPTVATGTPPTTPFDFKGTVGTAKSAYTLTTAKGIVFSVKNSKDAKVEAALKPLVGTMAELAGTHIPGAFDFTLITLNGAALPEIIVATSTLPVSTSTKPIATSTATSTPR